MVGMQKANEYIVMFHSHVAEPHAAARRCACSERRTGF